jgi:hypothetical protein
MNLGELEGSTFEVEIPGCDPEHETKIYVYDMAEVVDEDVAIMPVLDLQEVLHQ